MSLAPFGCVRQRSIIALASLLVLLTTLLVGCNSAPAVGGSTQTPSGTTLPRTSLPMPPVTSASGAANAQTFTLLNDQRATLSDYLGKVLVLDFWATYCLPCREAAPHLSSLQKQFGDRGVVVIGLNVGGPDDRAKIPEFVESLKIGYALGIPEPEMSNFYLGSDDKIPQTLVFDREGHIVKHFVGFDSSVSAELDRTIQELLAR
jgi:thiol-disulfide isomerase/thioredoxin